VNGPDKNPLIESPNNVLRIPKTTQVQQNKAIRNSWMSS